MTRHTVFRWAAGLALVAAVALTVGPAGGQPPGKKGGGKGNPDLKADQATFHYLLEHHKDIRRTVKKLDAGVETTTESDVADVAKKIHEHVPAMYERMKANRPLRVWDPLFAELFRHADKVKMAVEKTAKGVKVTETSDDPAVARLIQAHADVVSRFVETGFAEAHKEHPVPDGGKKK